MNQTNLCRIRNDAIGKIENLLIVPANMKQGLLTNEQSEPSM